MGGYFLSVVAVRPGKLMMKLLAIALARAELVGEKNAAWAKATNEAGVVALMVVTLRARWGGARYQRLLVVGPRWPWRIVLPWRSMLQVVLVNVAVHPASHRRPIDRSAVSAKSGNRCAMVAA